MAWTKTTAPRDQARVMSASSADRQPSVWGRAGAVWGIVGVVCLLSLAIGRLGSIALEALRMELGLLHWAVLVWGPSNYN